MRYGKFISIEGSDGAGKSTQLKRIESYLHSKNIEHIITREPGGTPLSEAIRTLLLSKDYGEMDDMTEMLLYAAARRQHIVEKILPTLAKGVTVVTDRFVDSSIAYQGYGRNLLKETKEVNALATGGRTPDLTIFLYLSREQSRERKKEMKVALDRMESQQEAFFQNVETGFLTLAEENGNRIVKIDASQSEEDVFSDIQSALERLYDVGNE
ncbi:MAG: dTMP kinase [Bacillota bacterium]